MFFNPLWPHELLDKILRRLLSTTFDGERENSARAIGRVFANHRLPVLAAALDYATVRRWTVFPAPWLPSKKGGLKKGLKSGRYSNGRPWGSTRDVVEIATDWLRWPQANVGVVCGPDSDCWVVEIDIKPDEGIDGGAALAWLEELNGKLPDTLMAITPSGSIHRYFTWPHDGRDIRNSASKVGRGIDIRGRGGMVIAPPSMRKGRRYRWINEGTPITDAPEWLIAAAIAASSAMPRSGGSHTPDPEEAFDADGMRQDGREAFMRNVVWREVREWYRELQGRLPPKPEWQPRCATAYETYEAAAVTRIDGVSKREGLEREGRGPTVFWEKWQYTMRKWGSPKMAANAANFEYDDDDDVAVGRAFDLAVERALDLWGDTEPLTGELAQRYPNCESLRFHPGLASVLALISDALTDEPQGVCIVSDDGIIRRSLGDISGGCIKITPDDDVGRTLTISADIATAIAAGVTQVWVVLAPDRFRVLHGIEEVTIIGGKAPATEARWRAAGRQVHVA